MTQGTEGKVAVTAGASSGPGEATALPAVFGASALAVLCSAAIVVGLLRRPNPVQAS